MTYIISFLQAVKERAEAATRAPPTASEAQAVEQYILVTTPSIHAVYV